MDIIVTVDKLVNVAGWMETVLVAIKGKQFCPKFLIGQTKSAGNFCAKSVGILVGACTGTTTEQVSLLLLQGWRRV